MPVLSAMLRLRLPIERERGRTGGTISFCVADDRGISTSLLTPLRFLREQRPGVVSPAQVTLSLRDGRAGRQLIARRLLSLGVRLQHA